MKILVSAGPTRESIDPVRFISNRSSGKMGYALAESAVALGHDVTLVSGPVSLKAPNTVAMIQVESAAEMFCEIRNAARDADLVIMAAAVADYRPVNVSDRKIKKKSGNLVLELERTQDILAWLGQNRRDDQVLVGFAAETDNLVDNAQHKLQKKNVDWIILNDVGQNDRGFAVDQNEVTMFHRDGRQVRIPLADKKQVAQSILREILQNQKES